MSLFIIFVFLHFLYIYPTLTYLICMCVLTCTQMPHKTVRSVLGWSLLRKSSTLLPVLLKRRRDKERQRERERERVRRVSESKLSHTCSTAFANGKQIDKEEKRRQKKTEKRRKQKHATFTIESEYECEYECECVSASTGAIVIV